MCVIRGIFNRWQRGIYLTVTECQEGCELPRDERVVVLQRAWARPVNHTLEISFDAVSNRALRAEIREEPIHAERGESARLAVCRVAYANFDVDSAASASARHLVSDLLDRWDLQNLKEDAELLTGELVNNAVRHASTELALVVAVAEGILEIGVTDLDPKSVPLVRPKWERMKEGILAEGGRGLLLIELLADEWGVVGLPQGKQVWFRLSTHDWSFRSACPCHSQGIDRVRLDSGRYALAVAGPWDS